MPARRTYTKACKRCGGSYEDYRNTRKPGVCARDACLRAETDGHNAAVDAYRAELAATPRRPRQARTPQPLYGDWGMLARMHGVRADGTGRKA